MKESSLKKGSASRFDRLVRNRNMTPLRRNTRFGYVIEWFHPVSQLLDVMKPTEPKDVAPPTKTINELLINR